MVRQLPCTSNKFGEKTRSRFFHCGSFDYRGLQSLNDYKKLIFILQLKIKRFGVCDQLLERYFKDLSNGIWQTPNNLKCQLVGQ